jgi:hypothetical protein
MKLSSVHKQIDNTNDFTEQSPIMNESDVSPYSKNLSPLKLKSFIQILETTGESKQTSRNEKIVDSLDWTTKRPCVYGGGLITRTHLKS